MTTIAYRDGTLAADSRAYSGDKHPIGDKIKIAVLPDDTMMACSTTVVGGGERVLDWVRRGKPEDFTLPDSFHLLVVDPLGDVFYANSSAHFSGPLKAPFIAIGSGEQYAHGAMMMGASAIEAVSCACKADVWSGGPIYAVNKAKGMWKVNA